MTQRRKNLSHGVSLTELLVLMSSCTLILSMSGILLHRVMHIEVDSRSIIDAERSCSRLAHQLREDVHDATSIDIKNDKPTDGELLLLQLPQDQTVAYSRSDRGIARVMSRKRKVVARDEFAFQRSCTVEVREEQSPKRVVLMVASPVVDQSNDKAKQLPNLKAVPVGLLIEACVNRNERLTTISSEQESAR
jgi:hypothetical protein